MVMPPPAEEKVYQPVDEEEADEFVLERSSTVAISMMRDGTMSKEMTKTLKLGRNNTSWKRQAWNRLESDMRKDDSMRRSRKMVGADHFRTDMLNLRKQDPTVEIVVTALKRYLDMDNPSQLTVYRILTYAVEAFFSNLYKEMTSGTLEDIKELSKVIVRVGIHYGNRGGPIRKEVRTERFL